MKKDAKFKARNGFGYTYTDGSFIPRYYDLIRGGWLRLRGTALLKKKNKR